MAGNRRLVSCVVWRDTWFEELSQGHKLLWLYLLTTDQNNLIGTYQLSRRRAAYEVGLSRKELDLALDQFRQANKIDLHGDWVYIVNFERHQHFTGVMRKHADQLLQDLPPEIIKMRSIDRSKDLSIDKLSKVKLRHMDAHMTPHMDPHMGNTPATRQEPPPPAPTIQIPNCPSVKLTKAQAQTVKARYAQQGLSSKDLLRACEILENYAVNGNAKKFKAYRDHSRVLTGWVLDRVLESKKIEIKNGAPKTFTQLEEERSKSEFNNSVMEFLKQGGRNA